MGCGASSRRPTEQPGEQPPTSWRDASPHRLEAPEPLPPHASSSNNTLLSEAVASSSPARERSGSIELDLCEVDSFRRSHALPSAELPAADAHRSQKFNRSAGSSSISPSCLLSAGGRRTRTFSRPHTAEGDPPAPQPLDCSTPLSIALSTGEPSAPSEQQWATNWEAILRSPPPTAPAKVRCDMSSTISAAGSSFFTSSLSKKPLSCTLGAVPSSCAVSSPLKPLSNSRASHSRPPTSSSVVEKEAPQPYHAACAARKEKDGGAGECSAAPSGKPRGSKPQSRSSSRPPSRDSNYKMIVEGERAGARLREHEADVAETRLSTINILRLSDNGIGEEVEEWSAQVGTHHASMSHSTPRADDASKLSCKLHCVEVGSSSLSLKHVLHYEDKPLVASDGIDMHAYTFQLQIYREGDVEARKLAKFESLSHTVERVARGGLHLRLRSVSARLSPLLSLRTLSRPQPLQPNALTIAEGLDGCGAAINCVRLEAQTGAIGMEETFYQSFPGVQPGSTMCTLAARGLAPNTRYRMRARGGNRKGEGPWSEPAIFQTLPETTEPMGPPRVWSKSAHSVLLVWLKPGADSSLSSRSALPGGAAGVGVTSTQQYELQMALHEEDGTVGEFQSVFFGRECKFDVNNLEPATDHSFRVRAEGPGEIGGCGWSEPVVVHTDSYVPAAPDPPALMRRDGRTMQLEWTVPKANGSPILRHELQVCYRFKGFTRRHAEQSTLTAHQKHASRFRRSHMEARLLRESSAATGLPPGSQCLFRVRAVNAVGAGPWSSPIRFCTQPEPPDAPTELSLQEQGAPSRQHSLAHLPSHRPSSELRSSRLHTHPHPNYILTLRAYNETGCSEWSKPFTARTAEAVVPPPAAPFVMSKTSTTMQIGWGRPEEGVEGGEEGVCGEEAVLWELQMDGGVRCMMNSDGQEESYEASHLRLKVSGSAREVCRDPDHVTSELHHVAGDRETSRVDAHPNQITSHPNQITSHHNHGFDFDASLLRSHGMPPSGLFPADISHKRDTPRVVSRLDGKAKATSDGKGGLQPLDRRHSSPLGRKQLPPLHSRGKGGGGGGPSGTQPSSVSPAGGVNDGGVAEEVMEEEVMEELQGDLPDGEFDTVMQGEPGLALGALGHSVKEEMDDVADEIPEEVSTPLPCLGRLYMGGRYVGQQADSLDEEYKGEEEEPAEEDGIAEDDEADPPPEGDVEMEGTHKFRLVYQGLARAFLITELSPACRYCFRLRFMGEEGRSGWSAGLVADTDAADSAHRIDFESLGVFETLGEGAFSVVYRGTWNREGSSQQVARVFGRGRGREGGEGKRERGKEMRDACISGDWRGIGGEGLLQIAMDVAQGCHYLHRQKPMIIHRDLKSQNILLATREGVAKIADFGLSRFFKHDVASMTGQVGTPGWTAPEVFKHNSYNHKVDVYSFGVVLAECLSREKPYAGMDAMQIAFATVYRNKRPPLPPSAPTPLQKLITSCWDADPKKRPPFSRVIDSLRGMERSLLKPEQREKTRTSSAEHTRAIPSAQRERAPLRPKFGERVAEESSKGKVVAQNRNPSPDGALRVKRQVDRANLTKAATSSCISSSLNNQATAE
ncbi:MAG: hypothetical protein SGPRY_002343 [Prymnesium sp.]